MKSDTVEDLIVFFEDEKLHIQDGSQFSEEELDIIIEALNNLDKDLMDKVNG